jgi:hypothetical protein
MKLYHFAFAFTLGLTACGSESADGRYKTGDEEINESQIDDDTKASIDSVAKATTKGDIIMPLPDTLTALLSQKQPPVQVPPLPDQVLVNKRLQIDNPLYLTGDFNGDNARDYAVQVLQNDSIHILAFLDYAGKPQEMPVASYPAEKLAGGFYTIYQLKLAPKDSVVSDFRNQQKRPLGIDGVSVVEENRTTLYVLKNNRFIPFDLQK